MGPNLDRRGRGARAVTMLVWISMRVVPVGIAVLWLGLTGCAQLFGIDNTSAPDAPANNVTLQLQRQLFMM